MNKFITTSLLTSILMLNSIFAQSVVANDIEMADPLVANGKIYIVVGVLSIVFVCIVAYLVALDRRISKLEKK